MRSRSIPPRFITHLSATALALAVMTITVTAGAQDAAPAAEESKPAASEAAPAAKGKTKDDDVVNLSDMSVTEDAMRVLSNTPSASSFGFTKPLLETPRSVSFVSEEQLSLMGISTVEDLTRVVPGVYTTTRYGLQGGVNVRAVQADNYYRGIKRLNMQGHARTVLEGMDSIEVVKGPPSPIYGMGKIGGYVNMVPKSGRAKMGGYMEGVQGFVQGIVGSYDRTEASFGVGGPASIMDKQAGYYVFGLVENSNSYIKQVGIKQRYLQATGSVDHFIGPFRLETGTQLQNSITTGAYLNRVTQDLIDHGRYISGQPLVDLDLNSDGRVGYVETYAASPVKGRISGNNQALTQRYAWPLDASGQPIPISAFPKVPGIPQTMKDYLVSHLAANDPSVNCRAARVMAAMPVGGPLPISGQLPVGFVLNPCTVGYTQIDYRRDGSWEREQNAKLVLGYADLIYDENPDFTLKNQLFYDMLDSSKDSFLPYGEKQDIHAVEEKITFTHKIPAQMLPSWLSINSLASVNYRITKGKITSSGGDFDWRQDVMQGKGLQAPNNTFWNQLDDNSYANGAPSTTLRSSDFDEMGIGIMFDIDIFRGTNLLIGGRYDRSHATASDLPPFDANFGVSPAPGVTCVTPSAVCPGRFDPPAPIQLVAHNTRSSPSYSVSLSQQLPWGLRPYATYAKTSLTLDGANNIMQATIVQAGQLGQAELREVGIKGSFFKDKLVVTTAAYQQSRNDIGAPSDPGAGANVSATEFRGVETEIKFAPIKNLFISGYALFQKGKYTIPVATPSGTNVDVSGRDLGYVDVVDPATGAVIYPAEAFLYGGRPQVVLPAGSNAFVNKYGDPETQLGLNASYHFDKGLGLLLSGNHFSAVWADRIQTVKLPAADTVDAAITWDKDNWHFKLNGYNITNERYFRANIADTNAKLVSAMPTTRWEFTIKTEFR